MNTALKGAVTIVGALVCMLALPHIVTAKTIVTGENLSHPYQKWANWRLNLMPAPKEEIYVFESETEVSGAWFEEAKIRMRLGPEIRWVWLHELGHRFDASVMRPRHRKAFANVVKPKGDFSVMSIYHPDWLDYEKRGGSFHEIFADAYKSCTRLRKVKDGNSWFWFTNVNWSGSFGINKLTQLCDIMKTAYNQKYGTINQKKNRK